MGLENLRVVSLAFLITLSLTACASHPISPEDMKGDAKTSSPAAEKPAEKPVDERENISRLQERVQDLETRLSALNDKINLAQGVTPSASGPTNSPPVGTVIPSVSAVPAPAKRDVKEIPETTVVTAPAAHAHTVPVAKPKAEAFVQDETVDRYREAKILFDSKRYSDSVVEFSNFVKNYPDHVLAPAAQYYVGIGYLQQKEYKLAEEELNRELMAYPHSQFTPDTLVALADVSASLNKPTRVLYYKEKLLSVFPHSPQANGIKLDSSASNRSASSHESHEATTTKSSAHETAEIETPEKPVPPTAPEKTSVGHSKSSLGNEKADEQNLSGENE